MVLNVTFSDLLRILYKRTNTNTMTIYAVHQASTLCGENETELYSNPIDAGVRYAELVADYLNQGDDLQIFEHTETEFYAENESSGTYDRIAVETLNIIS